MIGRQQSRAARDDAVTIMIGIACRGDGIAFLEADETLHGVRRRRIHTNSAIPIEGHELERGIDGFAHDVELQAIPLRNGRPIVNPRAAHGIDREVHVTNGVEVEHVLQITRVLGDVVMRMRGGCAKRLLKQESLYAGQIVPEKFVRRSAE